MERIHNIISMLENYYASPAGLEKKDNETFFEHLEAISKLLTKAHQPTRNRLRELIKLSEKLSQKNFDLEYESSEMEDEIDTIGIALVGLAMELKYSNQTLSNYDTRINELIEVLTSYSQLDFTSAASISEKQDEIDAIAFGLNMLGQEINFYQTQLKEKTHSLEEAQRIGNVGSWEWIIEKDEISWSDQLYQIYGVTMGTALSFEQFAKLLTPETLARLGEKVEKCIQQKESFQIIHPFYTANEGVLKYVQSIGELVEKDGKPYKLVGTALDITEQHNAKLELAQLNEELEQKVVERTADLESFTYSVSHDLRAPLRAIGGFSEILIDDYAPILGDEGKRLLNIVQDNANRMSQLIDDLLRFSRINNQKINHQKINMNELIQGLISELTPAYPSLNINIKVNELPLIKGDTILMKQVWQNLIDNAIKYSAKEEEINITIKPVTNKKHHIISIQDNGVGFDQQYQDKLYEVFQRLHSQDEFSGTGVGLSIVKRIIDKHGGEISVNSSVGKGATFAISIPKQK